MFDSMTEIYQFGGMGYITSAMYIGGGELIDWCGCLQKR